MIGLQLIVQFLSQFAMWWIESGRVYTHYFSSTTYNLQRDK